jgi:hypothetical protein
MPLAFERCVRSGGRVRRFSGPRESQPKLAAGEYVNICFLGGKSYFGEIHKAEESKKTEVKK